MSAIEATPEQTYSKESLRITLVKEQGMIPGMIPEVLGQDAVGA